MKIKLFLILLLISCGPNLFAIDDYESMDLEQLELELEKIYGQIRQLNKTREKVTDKENIAAIKKEIIALFHKSEEVDALKNKLSNKDSNEQN